MSETPPPTPRDDQTVQLDDQDVEMVAQPPAAPRQDDTLLEAEPDEASVDMIVEAQEPTAGEESFAVSKAMAAAFAPADPQATAARQFFVDEASALAERQPERAALMWLEAAEVAANSGGASTVDDLEAALALRGDSSWLLPRARRLLMRLGEYERALKLGTREVKLGGDTATRAAVLTEASAVVHFALGETRTALKLADNALRLTPRNVLALCMAVMLRRDQQAHAETAAGLEALAECLTDPAERAMCLYGAGTLHEMRLGSNETARAAYLRASEADPQNVPVMLALCEVHRATKSWPALGRALEHLADLIEDASFKGRLLRLAGTLYLDVCDDLESAARALGRAARALPGDVGVLSLLAHTQEARGRQRDAVQALRQLLEQTADKEGRAALLAQVAALHVELHESEQAIGAYREALAEVPGYLPALQALGTIYRQRGDFESLVAISQPETEGLLPSEARAVRCLDLAEVLSTRLERPDDAVGMYRRAIELSPDLHVSYWSLARLLRRMGWHEELSALLSEQAEVAKDDETRTHLLLQRARIEATLLGRPERALETLTQLGEQSLRAATFERMELYEQMGRHAELVELLLARGESTNDPREAEGCRVQAALLLEHELEEHERALTIYRQVLESNSKSHAALHGTGRILHRLARWNELVRLHHHELTSEPDRPDAAVLLCRVGRILDGELGNASAAISAYAKALKSDPAYSPALAAVDRLARKEKRWDDLVQVLERYADARGEGRDAAQALARGGEIAGWVVGDLERGVALYERAGELDADSRVPLEGLLQMRLRQERWSDAAITLQELCDRADSDEERAALGLQLARLAELRLDESPDLERYKLAGEGPFAASLREELLRVHRRLMSAQARDLLLELGRQTSDARLGAAYLLQAAHEVEFRAQTSDDELLEAAQLAYERQPEDPAVLWCLERQLLRARRWAELAALHEHEARVELDRALRVQALARAAEAHMRAEALDEAERACRECLNFDVHCLPALRLLADIAVAREDYATVAETCDRLAEASAATHNRLSYCLHAASVWHEKVGDESRALASLAVALADDPTESDAFERAEALLRSRGEHDELSRLYQRRIRATSDELSRVPLLRAHARLLRDELGRPDRALSELDALLSVAPGDVEAISELAALHEKRGHWSDAASALGLLVERAVDDDLRYQARLQQAQLWLSKLHETERARTVLDQCREERPLDAESARLRVELATTVGDWVGARRVLEELSGREDAAVAARVWALLRLGEVAQVGLHDDDLANRSVSSALAMAVGRPEALDALREHYPAADDKRRVVAAAESLLESNDDPALRRVVAQMLVEDLGDAARALPHLRAVVKSAPDDSEARMLLARALESEQPDDAVKRYRALIDENVAALAAYRGLVRVGPGETAAAAAAFVELAGEVGAEETVHLKTLEADVAPRGRFDASVLPAGSDEAFEQAFELLGPHLDELYPRQQGRAAGDALATSVQRVARTAGIGDIGVEVGGGGDSVALALGSRPTLRIGAELAADPRSPWLRFVVARSLLGCGPRRLALLTMESADLDDLFAAIHERKPDGELRQTLKKNIARVLPRRTRKSLEALGMPAQMGRFAATRNALERAAEPLALVLARNPAAVCGKLLDSGGVAASLQALAEHDQASKLARFAVSEDYARHFRTIWG